MLGGLALENAANWGYSATHIKGMRASEGASC